VDCSYPLYCSCRRNGGRVAVVDRQGKVTYEELERRIAALAGALVELGLGGATVATLSANTTATVALYMALARAGATAVPLNTRLTAAEKRYVLEDSGAAAILAEAEWVEEARALGAELEAVRTVLATGDLGEGAPLAPNRDADPARELEPATILYTSGTTGFPKGVVRSHRANAWNMVNSALGAPRTPDDVELFNLPAFGIGFLHFALPALLGGATLVLDGAFEAGRVWELLERRRVTRTFLAPTMIDAMLAVPGHEARDLSALETVCTAYAFPERLRRAALRRFGPVFVYMYGLTEAQLTCATADEFATEPSSVGVSMGVSEVAVLDSAGAPLPAGEVGEIGFAGPSLMSGYHGLPEASAEALTADGWLRTGDLGRFDTGGALHYAGRSKEMIKTGGFSVDPVEVENAILAREEVREAAVVGAESERWGEEVVAVVSLRPGGELDEGALLAACRERIASYKVPKRVFVLAELPKNATGKVERGRLRDLVAELVG
jgi:acyl-CoA synthetase (AMP-forming)/AMP-acid ligase II